VIKPQNSVHSVVEFEDGNWILKLTADLVKRIPQPPADTEAVVDVPNDVGSLFGKMCHESWMGVINYMLLCR
jgi:hypothetical protein